MNIITNTNINKNMDMKTTIHQNNEKKKYRFRCEDREYNKWCLYDSISLSLIDKSSNIIKYINPIKEKLLDQDTFIFNKNTKKVGIIHSSVREMPLIPGVLILDKQYGMLKEKYLYKLYPDDRRLPVFLVPYKIKKIGFEKNKKNIYVTIKFIHWKDKHPVGNIIQKIGDVDILNNFYEYQLYCKSLNASIQKFTKKALKSLQEKSEEKYIEDILKNENIEDRRDKYIITIDPKNSKDYDDGFGLEEHLDGSQVISIYISNVTIWMDVLDLWDSFSKRISTIYLPDRKRPMLPSLLSDCLCSLVENRTRFAFTMDLKIKDNEIIETKFCNSAIKVRKNYGYECKTLNSDKMYQKTLYYVSLLSRKIKYIDVVKDSHDLVTYLMILMNYITAKEFLKYGNGIFRGIRLNEEANSKIPNDLSKKMKSFLTQWNSTGGQYMKNDKGKNDKNNNSENDNISINSLDSEEREFIEKNNNINEKNSNNCINKITRINSKLPCSKNKNIYLKHDILKFDAYVHITSPIRRLVDLLNIMELQQSMGIYKMNEKSKKFFQYWTNDSQIEYINTTMRSIRKLQGDCEFLQICINKPEMLNQVYEGYVFDRIERKDGLYQYVVYLPKLNIVNRHTTRNFYNNYSNHSFKIYLFNNQNSFKKKILLGYYENFDEINNNNS